MLDSILNASWWPWSRSESVTTVTSSTNSVTPTNLIPIRTGGEYNVDNNHNNTGANLFNYSISTVTPVQSVTVAESVTKSFSGNSFRSYGASSTTIPSTVLPVRASTILNSILNGLDDDNDGYNGHRGLFNTGRTDGGSSTSSASSSPSTTPPDSPGETKSLSPSFDFSPSSTFYDALYKSVNWSRTDIEQDSMSPVTSPPWLLDRNLTGTIITFDNYTANYTNDTVANGMAAVVTGVVTSNDSDYNWLMVPPWNCTTCQPSLLPFDPTFLNTTTGIFNQTQIVFDGTVDQENDDESSIYLIQIILTALVLGIVILSTVIGKFIQISLCYRNFLNLNLNLLNQIFWIARKISIYLIHSKSIHYRIYLNISCLKLARNLYLYVSLFCY